MYTTVKLIGAAHLIVLGIRGVLVRKNLPAALISTVSAPRSLTRTIREGFVVALLSDAAWAFTSENGPAVARLHPSGRGLQKTTPEIA